MKFLQKIPIYFLRSYANECAGSFIVWLLIYEVRCCLIPTNIILLTKHPSKPQLTNTFWLLSSTTQTHHSFTFVAPPIRLAHLQLLKATNGDKIEIIKIISPKWKDIGTLLDFDQTGATLNQIQANEGAKGVEACCRAMLQYWLEGKGKQPATWTTLLGVLQDSNFQELARRLKRAVWTTPREV